jgi:hypothetical protein
LIAYAFPPVGGAGVQRPLKWVKYLPAFGWKPYVLTAKNPSVPVFDPTLVREIGADIPVRRTFSLEIPYRFKRSAWNRMETTEKNGQTPSLVRKSFQAIRGAVQSTLLPDPQIGWWPTAHRAALRWIRTEKINAVITTGPPFSTHLLGKRLKDETGIPWIADFRDEWVDFYTRAYDYHRRSSQLERVEFMERSVVESASALVTVTDGILVNYRKNYSCLNERNSFCVRNGFDPEDFAQVEPIKTSGSRLMLTYSGTVFEVTSARYFLAGLKKLLTERPETKKELLVRFVGRIDPREVQPFADPIFQGVVETSGYVAHAESIRAIAQSDALLILLSPMEGSNRILTGKIFEYLAVRKPILSVIPEGELADLIKKTGVGSVVHPENVSGIHKSLEGLLQKWKASKLAYTGQLSEVGAYDRKQSTGRLASILSTL